MDALIQIGEKRTGKIMAEFFQGIAPIKFEGKNSRNPLSFKYYDKDQKVRLSPAAKTLGCVVRQSMSTTMSPHLES